MNNINLYRTDSANNYAGKVVKYQLENNLQKVKPNKGYTKVIFCIYKKIDIYDKQFLQYLLYKYKDGKELYLPFIDTENLEKDFLQKVFKKEEYSLVGYRVFNNCLLTFIRITETDIKLIKHEANDVWWWVTIDEIVNVKSVYLYKIHGSVTEIFYMNEDMCFLLDDNDIRILSPTVYYKGDNLNVIDFQLIFGFFRSSVWNKLGPFYNFSSCETAVYCSSGIKRYISSELYKNTSNRCGIVRVAIFVDKQKIFLNSEKDPEQPYSDVELLKLEDKTLSEEKRKSIINFRRMNDFQGDWSLSYDSAQTGNVVEKGKVVYNGYNNIALKDFNNIVRLDYTEFDKEK